MNSLRISKIKDHSALYIVLAVALLVLSTFLPAFASAAQITARSVSLSNSSINGTNVSYEFTFTADNASAGGIAVEFCSNTPLIGEDCTAPGNSFSVASGNVTGGTKHGTWTANRAFITKSVASGSNSFTLTGVTNPSVASTLFARVVTYDTDVHAAAYDSDNLGTGAIDNGSVAFAITNTIDVSGAVLEALTFCTSGAALTDPDTDNNYCETATAPTLTLGHDVGDGVIALTTDALDTANDYTQLSTNATGGAVVRIKSNAVCGGLIRDGDSSQTASAACSDIPAAGTSGTFAAGTAKFGVKVATADLGDNPSTNKLVVASGYDTDDYRLNWVSGNGSGVSSTYGDEILNTGGQPAIDQGATLTFGASIGNGTPAGKYRATLSLIATGTF